ncbi:hypothetical protein E3N88_33189 [Mikania micrantha]|uniref:RRM domain-containing protein n=1 Tax=Mikania micrantha TaxID=192012 RepID=A0A5N6MAK8_9ASTR|nr:hypothetical protein E3N88_33189 [Mikania micrantha]
MDEDAAIDVDASSPRGSTHIAKLKSAITGGSVTAAPKKTKGRGFREETDAERNNRMSGRFDSLDSEGGPGPERCTLLSTDSIVSFGYGVALLFGKSHTNCPQQDNTEGKFLDAFLIFFSTSVIPVIEGILAIEGWIILVTGVHEETQEDDLQNAFGEFGEIKNLHLNLDRRTGFVKGYGLIEYENFEEAEKALTTMDGGELLTQTVTVDWAFSKDRLVAVDQ